MITFLPLPSFSDSACVLDNARLTNQVTEALAILQTIVGKSQDYKYHPAVLMWITYPTALHDYIVALATEVRKRGLAEYPPNFFEAVLPFDNPLLIPPFIGDNEFHASHRAALLHKKPEWYSGYGWTETPEQCYVWPVRYVTSQMLFHNVRYAEIYKLRFKLSQVSLVRQKALEDFNKEFFPNNPLPLRYSITKQDYEELIQGSWQKE